MKSVFSLIACSASLACIHAAGLPAFFQPSISPDRPEVAFVSGGDIWTVPLAGGEAHLLVSHPAAETRPLYSPDGTKLAFTSTRTGNGDIYLLDLNSGDLKRITHGDGLDQLEAWSRDGQWLYFSLSTHDIAGMSDIYRVRATGGTPMPVSDDQFLNEYFAAPSPSGDVLAFNAEGIVNRQFWRHGHSHIDQCEIWLRHAGTPARYERVTEGKAKDAWPMWSADGKRIYFMSDRSGAENIWVHTVSGKTEQVTRFTDGRLLWPSMSYDGRTIVFERNLGIWKLDTASGKAAQIKVVLRGAPAAPGVTHQTLVQGFRHLDLSKDGKKIAFVAHGEVFAAAAKEGGTAQRVTMTPASESAVRWAPDNRRLVYVSDRSGPYRLFLYDVTAGIETPLTDNPQGDHSPQWSPDGKHIAFIRGDRELHVYDPATKSDRLVAKGLFDQPPLQSDQQYTWSPDSHWIAYLSSGYHHFTNAYVVPLEGGEARPVSFLPNTYSSTITWSPDGKFLLFHTGQRTENGQIARVDLIPRTPKFREDVFRDLFREENPKPQITTPPIESPKPATPQPADPNVTSNSGGGTKSEPATHAEAAAAAKPQPAPRTPNVRVVFDDIRRRISFLPIGLDCGDVTISPDSKTVVVIAEAAGQQNLYSFSIDELAKEPAVAKQLTSTPTAKRNVHFTPDGKEVYFLDGGKVQTVTLESKIAKPVPVIAEMDIDFDSEKREVFDETYTYLRDNFFDASFHGADWSRLRSDYEPYVEGAKSHYDLLMIISLMIGELNASHSGIALPSTASVTATGRLGLRFAPAEYENSGRLKITRVISLSPAALSGDIKPGQYLLAVDGRAIDGKVDLDELLEHKIDRRVVLTVSANADGSDKRDIAVRPVNTTTEKNLLYRDWVENRRAYVSKISEGRLGYVHMPDMSSTSLENLALDLDAENSSRDGVVIDVRNNNGGFVNAYALDILARKGYMVMTERGQDAAPARSLLGQRALEKPTILVTNRDSLSDAEDFTEGYRELKLGKVVGEPTAGWIIYTANTPLIDGSVLRLPRIRVTTSSGEDMEMHPRPVDVFVERPVGESYNGTDVQLERAVSELLKQIGGPTTRISGQTRAAK